MTKSSWQQEPGWVKCSSHLVTKLMSVLKRTVEGLSARPRYCRLSSGHAGRRAGYHSLSER